MTNYNYFHVWRDITFRDAGRDITLPEGHDVILGGDVEEGFWIVCKGEKINISRSTWNSLGDWNHYLLRIKWGKQKFREKKINFILDEKDSSDWRDL
jgi:hypothetical protein